MSLGRTFLCTDQGVCYIAAKTILNIITQSCFAIYYKHMGCIYIPHDSLIRWNTLYGWKFVNTWPSQLYAFFEHPTQDVVLLFKKTSALLESPYGRVWNMAIGNGAHLITRALVRSSSSQRYSVGFRSGFCAGYSGSFCSSFGKSCLLWSLHCVQGRCCAGRGLGLEFRLKENCNSTAFKDMRLFNASKMTATEPHINLIL